MSLYLTELSTPSNKEKSTVNRAKQKLLRALNMSGSIKEINQMLFNVRCWTSQSSRLITNLSQKIYTTEVISKEKKNLLHNYSILLEKNKNIANEMYMLI